MPRKERLYTEAEVERLICWMASLDESWDTEPETIQLLATCHDYEHFLTWRQYFSEQQTFKAQAARKERQAVRLKKAA
jgi:hypothetical protein